MATKKSVANKDEFAQKMYLTVTQSAANATTFSAPVSLGIGMFNQGALVIHKVEYIIPDATFQELVAAGDTFNVALVGDNTLTSITSAASAVYDQHPITTQVITAVGQKWWERKLVEDFSTLPGGGMLIPADKLYLALGSAGFAAAQSATAIVWFTVRSLTAEQYLELAQSLRVFI